MKWIIALSILLTTPLALAERDRAPSNEELNKSSKLLRRRLTHDLKTFTKRLEKLENRRDRFQLVDTFVKDLDNFYDENIYDMNRDLRSDINGLRHLYIPAGLPAPVEFKKKDCVNYKAQLMQVSHVKSAKKLDKFAKWVLKWQRILCQ